MISVIIPVYNTARYLKRCIDSVLRSSYKEFEVLLVDDGSVDGSSSICRKYGKKDSRVKYYRQEHQGVSAARNRGIRESRGEWLVFVDSDDFISGCFLESVAREKYQEQELLVFDYMRFKKGLGREKAAYRRGCISYKKRDMPYLTECLLNMCQPVKGGNVSLASPCAKAYRRSVIERHLIYFSEDIARGEDRLFNIEYFLHAGSCTYIRMPVYFVEARMDSTMRRFSPDFLENDVRYQKKLRLILKKYHLFHEVENAYYNNVLSNMSDVLVRGIFNPGNPGSYKENVCQCRRMRDNPIYRQAVKHSKNTGNLPRRLLIFFYDRKCYRITELICRVSYFILKMAGLW